jgi:diguanylate cyclase (GGDEF)-like protein
MLLCELAERFSACVRATDTVARMGGDEFIILLPDLHVPVEAERIAAKIVAAASNPMSIDEMQVAVTVSIGLVTYPEEGSDVESLLRCADEAMYAAKEEGKNRLRVYRRKTADDGDAGEQVRRQLPVPAGKMSA